MKFPAVTFMDAVATNRIPRRSRIFRVAGAGHNRPAWLVLATLAGLSLWAPPSDARGAEPPAPFEATITSFVTGGCSLNGAGSTPGGRSESSTAAFILRRPVAAPEWYCSGGLQLERFQFSAGPVSRLQDVAATLALEYYRDGEPVAALTIHPGFYFGQHATSDAWDVPVDLISGVPLIGTVNGVVGFSNARFYHHALPIFGLVWTSDRRVRVQLVFPEPAVEVTPNAKLSLRLGGELIGNGFLAVVDGRRTPVEYSSYHVGVTVTYTPRPGLKVSFSSGIEAERNFDAFRTTGRQHGSGAGFAGFTAVYSR